MLLHLAGSPTRISSYTRGLTRTRTPLVEWRGQAARRRTADPVCARRKCFWMRCHYPPGHRGAEEMATACRGTLDRASLTPPGRESNPVSQSRRKNHICSCRRKSPASQAAQLHGKPAGCDYARRASLSIRPVVESLKGICSLLLRAHQGAPSPDPRRRPVATISSVI